MNDINQLLGDWAARHEPTPTALNSLQARIAGELLNVNETSATQPAAVAGRRDDNVRSTVSVSWMAVVSVAASLLAVVTVFWSGRQREVTPLANAALAALPATDLAGRQLLFRELDRMFDGHWRWFGEVNGRVHVQTDDGSPGGADGSPSDNPGLAVRLTVVQRRPGDANWRVVWETSVLARSEEWVRLPAELLGNNAVSVWAYSLPDGSVLVENDVSLSAPVPVRLSEPQFFSTSNRHARLWSAHRADGEFQLIQSVARLEANHG